MNSIVKLMLFFYSILNNTYYCHQIGNNKYSIEKNLNIKSTVDPTWIIKSCKVKTKMSCLAECNLNKVCLSLIFNTDSSSIDNCLLYNKHFYPNELITSNTSNLYDKERKYKYLSLKYLFLKYISWDLSSL